jgi:flavin-dependent dehydrogenase
MTAVLGAGPAGCAAAIALARAGQQVLLLERQPVPAESVCGEFLGPDAAAALATLGLDLPGLGAVALREVVLPGARRPVPLPFAAWALPRRVLDGALREAAVAAGVELRRGVTIRGAEPDGEGWRLHLPDGGLAARRIILATGKHGLRGHPRAGAPAGAVGQKLHLAGVEMGAAVALLPFAGGYAGLQPLPGGGANLCAALHGEPARDAAGLLAPVAEGSPLAGRLLRDARPLWARPLSVGAVPYGFRQPGGGPPGLYRVGDQAAVIPSFTGEGVALALHSGLAAAAAILAGREAGEFHAEWRRRSARPMRLAGLGAWVLRRWPAGFAAAGPVVAQAFARATRLPLSRPATG